MSSLVELREALEYAGLKPESAERIAYTLQNRDFIKDNLATKEDILQTEIKLRAEIQDVKESVQDVKRESLMLRQEIVNLENKILWFFAGGFALVVITQILLKFVGLGS